MEATCRVYLQVASIILRLFYLNLTPCIWLFTRRDATTCMHNNKFLKVVQNHKSTESLEIMIIMIIIYY